MPMTSALANALFAASRAHPEQRVGELMFNAMLAHNGEGATFWIEDAELIAALNGYAREADR